METALAIFIICLVLLFILLLKQKKSKKDGFVANYRMKNSSVPITMYDNQFVNNVPEQNIAVPSSMSAYRNLQIYDTNLGGINEERDPVDSYMKKNREISTDSVLPTSIGDRQKMVPGS